MEQREERQFGIGVSKQIEVVTEVPAFTRGIPSNRAIRLREIAIAIAGEVSGFPAIACMVGAETRSSDNRRTVAGNVELAGIHLSTANGFIQEA